MRELEDEQKRLRSVALLNAQSILRARERAELELIDTREALTRRTEELQASLALTRATLEATTDALLVVDGEGRVIDCNDRALELLGTTREAARTKTHRELVAWAIPLVQDPAAYLARIDAIYAAPHEESFDVAALADGRVFERSSRPHVVGDRVVGRVWTFRDVTERVRAEEAERDERRVLELGTTIASTLDLSELIQRVTDACTELSGARYGAFFHTTQGGQGEALDLYCLSGASREVWGGLGQPRRTALLTPTFEGQPPVRIADVLVDPRYGATAPHHGMPHGHVPIRSYLAVSVRSRSGKAIGALLFGHPDPGVFSERSERLVAGVASQVAVAIDNARLYADAKRAAEERARHLDAERAARAAVERVSMMKDEFLATLSHELRTPLNAVLGWAELLKTKKHADPQVAHAVDAIVRNARAQAQLIEDLLDMNRIMSGKIRLDVQAVDLAGVVSAALDAVRPTAEAKSITLKTVFDRAVTTVSGDATRLQQVVWNLLSNALKFTPKGGRVNVLLASVGQHVELTVADSGDGIDPLFLPHVFERFRQADASTTRSAGGLGLGLSIVKQLAELHGGTVRAESAGLGRGATFILRLPIDAGDEGSTDDARRTSTPSGGLRIHATLRGLKVLVVDDERDARELMKQLLVAAEADVVEAGSADEAISVVASARPDVLISDIGMPGKDGYQLLKQLRRLSPEQGGRTPAIALTAFARSEDRTRSMRAGYQIHLSKPVELSEVIAAIGALVGRTEDD